MTPSRREVLGAALAPLVVAPSGLRAHAQSRPTPLPDAFTPILFVHGNGDTAALWITTLWRFESNGYPGERMAALNFTDPLARVNDAEPQPGRSSTADQLRELAAAIDALRARTGAARVALVGSSRGGYAIRNYVQSGGAANVSHAILCGVPNRGVYDWEFNPGSEFNGRAPFLRRLNAGETDVVAGTAFLTLRSDGNDKFAQPDGRLVGRPNTPTGITSDGPSLRGATNVALGDLDHREVAFHPRAFLEMYRFIVGREPTAVAIRDESEVTLDGLLTGFPAGVPTNRPLADVKVDLYRVSPETGERIGDALHSVITAADGRWGPAKVGPAWYLEFVIEAVGYPTTHIYRSPFPRSSSVVHLRPGRPLGQSDAGAGCVVTMSRPRGYFGLPRDDVRFDGKEPSDITRGVPTDSVTTVRLPVSKIVRPLFGSFRSGALRHWGAVVEAIPARSWPAAENHMTIAELTY